MRPTEVLMQQADLLARLTPRTSMFYDIVSETVASMWSTTPEYGRIASEAAIQAAERGETFLVDERMTDVVMAAADSLDDTDRVELDMFPSRHGVMRFNRPLTFTDIRGQTCKIHWVTWSITQSQSTNAFGSPVTRRAIVATLWNDLSDPDDAASQIFGAIRSDHPHKYADMRKALGRWQCVGAYMIRDGHRIGPLVRDVDSGEVDDAQELAQSIVDMGGRESPPLVSDAKVVNIARILWASVLLMGQEVVSTARSEHSKAETKILRRNGLSESLTVVTLRRRRSGEPGEPRKFAHEYDYRWLTRGHFAWRKCGESHPLAQPYAHGYRARVWINPYLKGPEGAPVRTTKKVYRLAR